MVHQTELLRLRRSRYVADIPDTLYMVEDKPRTMGVDVLAAAIPGTFRAFVLFFFKNLYLLWLAMIS